MDVFPGAHNLYNDKPISEWGEAEFRSVFESVYHLFGTDIAWQLLYRLIQLRAGEIDEVQFNADGNPLEAMSVKPEEQGAYRDDYEGVLEDVLEDAFGEMEAYDEDFDEDFDEEDYDEDFDEDYDDDDDDGDDYRERYGNAGRFF